MKKILSLLIVFAIAFSFVGKVVAEETVVELFGVKVEIAQALQEYAKLYNEKHPGVSIKIETVGGGADYPSVLKAKHQAGKLPTIIQFDGKSGYNEWNAYAVALNDEEFTKYTDLSYVGADGKIVGFPVALEGYGITYNKEILEKAQIDPTKLVTRQAYEEAFKKIDSMKDELGLDAVVAAGTSLSGNMWWCMAMHIFSVYFSGGLEYGDTSIYDLAMQGKVDEARLKEFAEYIALLMKYSDPVILSTGDYNAQLTSFLDKKTAFLLEGNWIDPTLEERGIDFEIGVLPHAFLSVEDHGIQINPTSWYMITNAASDENQVREAINFLNSMVVTEEGNEYMVKKAGMVPAYNNVKIKPEGYVSRYVMEYYEKGGNHKWFFPDLPSNFTKDVIGPIFDLYAQDPQNIDVDSLYNDMKEAIEKIPSMS